MADLPDIDTSKVSLVAYWNAITDGGANSDNFDPGETTSTPAFRNTTVYDNGVQADIDLDDVLASNFLEPQSEDVTNFKCRVKSDGWFVVWSDRTVINGEFGLSRPNFGNSTTGPIKWNGEWADRLGGGGRVSTHRDIINDAQAQLSSTSPTFQTADVGHDLPQYPNATTIAFGGHGASNSGTTTNQDYSYSAGTTLYVWQVSVGAIESLTFSIGGFSKSLGVDTEFAKDLLGDGVVSSSGTYTSQTTASGGAWHSIAYS